MFLTKHFKKILFSNSKTGQKATKTALAVSSMMTFFEDVLCVTSDFFKINFKHIFHCLHQKAYQGAYNNTIIRLKYRLTRTAHKVTTNKFA